MKLMLKSLFFSLIISMLALNVSYVSAVEPTAKIYPTEGTVYTDIFLQVRGFGIGEEWDVHYKLYLFWDSKPIMTGVDDGGNHIYDIYFNPPNEPPYSDLGNHTVFVELWRSHYGWTFIANFTLIFEIIEWAPSPEYVALNATYYSLLGNYSSLLDDYNTLLADYNELLDDHNSLSNNYSDLFDSYDSLANHYDSLNSSYNELRSDYDILKSNFNSLESNNENLSSSYNALVNEMSSVRNLSYIFTVTTLILVVTTVYFAIRKPL